MFGIIIRFLFSALGLWLASMIVPGIHVADLPTLFAAALLLGLANVLVKPLLIVITLPFTILTLGLFLLVINAAMLMLVGLLLHGFVVQGFVAALLGSIVVSLVSWVGHGLTRGDRKVIRREYR